MSEPTKPTESGTKYLQLTDSILMEYVYVCDRYDNSSASSIDNDIIDCDNDGNYMNTYGANEGSNAANPNTIAAPNKYCITRNAHVNEFYFMNNTGSANVTNNTIDNTLLPISRDQTQWVEMKRVAGCYYSKYDIKWSDINYTFGESSIEKQPYNDEYVPYDIVRFYFQSGYHSEYDGFIFNIYTRNRNNEYINLMNVLCENYVDYKMCAEPLWFADKLYTNYVEYRIPSTAYLSSDMGNSDSMATNGWYVPNDHEYDRKNPDSDTLPYYLTHSVGFYNSPAIGIDLHAIVGYRMDRGFKVLKSTMITSTMFPNKDAYERLSASVRPATDGEYYKLYAYYENNPEEPIYDYASLYEYLTHYNNTFSVAHIITVTETYTDENNQTCTYTQVPITYIQTWDNLVNMYDSGQSPEILFRPVLKNTARMLGGGDGARINYVVRISNNKDNTTIIKSASTSIINPRRFGLSMVNAQINTVNDVHVYNRVESGPVLNVNTITRPLGSVTSEQAPVQVNTYVTSSFIDRRNIKIRVSPVRIEEVE